MKRPFFVALLAPMFAYGAPSGMDWRSGQRVPDTMRQQFDTLKANQDDLHHISVSMQGKLNSANGSRVGGTDTGTDVSNGVAIGGGPVGRSVAAHFSDIVSIADYGAKCDGTTDDTASAQAAITDVSTNPKYAHGVRIYIPYGVCLISSPLSFSTLDGRSISIRGSGITSSTLRFSGTDGLVISMQGGGLDISDLHVQRSVASGVGNQALSVTAPHGNVQAVVSNVQIDGTDQAVAWQTGAVFRNIGPQINHLYVNGFPNSNGADTVDSYAIGIFGALGPTSAGNIYAIDAKIVNSVFVGSRTGIRIGGAVQGVFVTNSEAIANDYGIYWDSTATAPQNAVAELLLVNNFHVNSHSSGIYTAGMNQVSVHDGLILHYAPSIDQFYGVNITKGQDATVSGLQINGDGSAGHPETFIRLGSYSVASVIGNKSLTLNGPSIDVSGSAYISVIGNTSANFPNYSGDRILGCNTTNVMCVANNMDNTFAFSETTGGNVGISAKGNVNVKGKALFVPQVFSNSTSGYGFNVGGQPYNVMTSTGPLNVSICGSSNCTIGNPSNTVSILGAMTAQTISAASLKLFGNLYSSGKVCLDANCARYVYEDAPKHKVKIGNSTNGDVFSIDDKGNVLVKGSLTQNSNP